MVTYDQEELNGKLNLSEQLTFIETIQFSLIQLNKDLLRSSLYYNKFFTSDILY